MGDNIGSISVSFSQFAVHEVLSRHDDGNTVFILKMLERPMVLVVATVCEDDLIFAMQAVFQFGIIGNFSLGAFLYVQGPLSALIRMCAFMLKCHRLPFMVWPISESRFLSRFLLEQRQQVAWIIGSVVSLTSSAYYTT